MLHLFAQASAYRESAVLLCPDVDAWQRLTAFLVQLLYDLEYTLKITRTQIKTLISIGYFEEFGSTGKLLDVFSEFCNKKQDSKRHCAQVHKRLG